MRRKSRRIAVLSALLAAVMGIGALDARAQATRTGHEVTVGIGSYTYIEPGDLRISIHGPKLAIEYTGTLLLNERKRWFQS